MQLMPALLNLPEHFVNTSVLVSIVIFLNYTLSDSVKFHLLLVSTQQKQCQGSEFFFTLGVLFKYALLSILLQEMGSCSYSSVFY